MLGSRAYAHSAPSEDEIEGCVGASELCGAFYVGGEKVRHLRDLPFFSLVAEEENEGYNEEKIPPQFSNVGSGKCKHCLVLTYLTLSSSVK